MDDVERTADLAIVYLHFYLFSSTNIFSSFVLYIWSCLDYNPNPTGLHPAFQSKGTPYKPDPDASMGDKMPVLKKGGGH